MHQKAMPDEVMEIAVRCMEILGHEGPLPDFAVVNNLGSKWLGRCTWRSSRTDTTLIELQRRVFANRTTLERVLAHEMVHHWEATQRTELQIAALRIGIRPASHGREFFEGAAKINAVMGDNFVTERSDTTYELPANTQEFYLLIMLMSPRNNRLGWAWSKRPSAQGQERITKECTERRAKLVMSTDERWLDGTKIARFGGMSLPPMGSEDEMELRRLYDFNRHGLKHA